MILSVSRRTDVPSYYSEWFLNRIKEGFLYVRNPMNPKQISRIDLSPEVVDCIVFWTKNPEPMLEQLKELEEYQYYFQFTLTGYGKDIECNVPHKKEQMIPIFQRLSKNIGAKRVIWRYDPILFNEKYSPEYHVKAFGQIVAALKGYTEKCVISFVDEYAKNKKSLEALKIYNLPDKELREFVRKLHEITAENGMKLVSCAEALDLQDSGVEHGSCIDRELIEELIGCKLKISKDKGQRPECGCVESVEVGTYNTCRNGCKYCYANHSPESVIANGKKYDVNSPLLCGRVTEEDVICVRKVKSLRDGQISLF